MGPKNNLCVFRGKFKEYIVANFTLSSETNNQCMFSFFCQKKKMDVLLKHLSGVLKGNLSDEVMHRIREGLTLDSFVLLNEEDLRELGLKMGERKLLMSWIKSSVTAQSSTECSLTLDPISVSTPAAVIPPLPASDVVIVEPQVYAIKELLCNYTKGGSKIVEKLKQGIYYTRSERILMIKVLGKYLMKNCLISKEMTNMAKSIVTEFPVLFCKSTPNGYEEIYCEKGATGYLAQYVRQKRHRDPFIKKHWAWRKNRIPITNPLPNIDDDNDDERRLRESRPTKGNLSELVQLMHKTRENRRAWINVHTCNPDATSILNRFPRLFDVNELINKEFAAIAGEFLSLRIAWLSFR
nr:uncharacterized protein LOC124816419 isoform X2 [Hydra vulgaris]